MKRGREHGVAAVVVATLVAIVLPAANADSHNALLRGTQCMPPAAAVRNVC
jgi:hypothetical protein